MIRTGPDLNGFSRWLRRQLKWHEKHKGWGITRFSQEAEVSRSAVTRWRDADWSKGVPTRPVVERLCNKLKLDNTEPFGYFGWDPAGPNYAPLPEPEPEPESIDAEYERYFRLLRTAITDPDVPEEDQRYFQRQLRSAAREYEEILAEREGRSEGERGTA